MQNSNEEAEKNLSCSVREKVIKEYAYKQIIILYLFSDL